MGLWSKSERGELGPPSMPQTGGTERLADLQDLIGELKKAGDVLGQIGQGVVTYLVRRESQAPAEQAAQAAPAGDGDPVLREKLGELENKIDVLSRQEVGLCESVQALRDQLEHGFQQLAEILTTRPEPIGIEIPETRPEPIPAAPIVPAAPAAMAALVGTGSGDWERAILGPTLAARPELAPHRQQLMEGVLDGDAGALALAGQMLLFQSASPERMPQMLKEIGEAYYRWRPKRQSGTSTVEGALASWLQKACENAGIRNTIEMVHPGERFDASRHHAPRPGVEITEVHGWIVLRDNGKVYTKATVSVR